MDNKNLNDIVLFNSSLNDLNSIDKSKQYKIVKPEFTSKLYSLKQGISDIRNKDDVREELSHLGYNGLIFVETTICGLEHRDHTTEYTQHLNYRDYKHN